MSVGADLPLGSGWKAADGTAFRASVTTLVFPTKGPLNWSCARWPEGSLFGHWRSGVVFVQVICRSTRRGVREHPAPSGALRPLITRLLDWLSQNCQGAPSTIRCIETRGVEAISGPADSVREHPAPSGALRLQEAELLPFQFAVREHPAPSGALRHGFPHTLPRPTYTASGSTQHHQVH